MEHSHHINPAFDQALAEMDDLLEAMEDAVLAQIVGARQAFQEMSATMAKGVRKKDKALNELAVQAEDKAIAVLVRHQPLAEDLRHTVGALKMTIEYERCADYVKHLAKGVSKLSAHNENLEVFPSLQHMLEEVEAQFTAAMAARRAGDTEEAVRVWLKDQRIDDLCAEAVRESFDNQKKGDGNVHSLLHAMSVARNIERIGDKIKNLMEILYKQKTGDALDIKVED